MANFFDQADDGGTAVADLPQTRPPNFFDQADAGANFFDQADFAKPEGAFMSAVRPIGRYLPTSIATATGGLLAGAAASETGPGAIVADIAAGTAAGTAFEAARTRVKGPETIAQEKAQLEANYAAHPFWAGLGTMIGKLPAFLGGGSSFIGKTAKAEAKAAGTAYEATRAARVAETAVGGARMSGAEAGARKFVEGEEGVSIPEEITRGAVTMGPLGLVGPARGLLGQFVTKPVKDATTMVVANALYDRVVHGKEVDPESLVKQIGTDAPAFAILSLAHGINRAKRSGKPPPENFFDQADAPLPPVQASVTPEASRVTTPEVSGQAPVYEADAGSSPAAGAIIPPAAAGLPPIPGAPAVAEATPEQRISGTPAPAEAAPPSTPSQPPAESASPTIAPGASPAESTNLQSAPEEAAPPADTTQAPPSPPATSAAPSTSAIASSSPDYPKVPGGSQAPYAGPTGIRNAAVDAERAARGLPPLMQPARREWGTAWDEASALIDQDANAGERLVDELNGKPRSLSDTENALLLQHKLSVQDQIRRTVEVINDPAADEAAKATARLDMARHNAALDAVDNAGKSAGTHMGRGLNARKMWAGDEDFYQLPTMLAREQAMKGEPLTPREVDEVQARAAAIDKARAAMLAHDDAVAAREAHEGATRIVEGLKQEAATAPDEVAAEAASETIKTLEQQRAAAMERVRARREAESAAAPVESDVSVSPIESELVTEEAKPRERIREDSPEAAPIKSEIDALVAEADRRHAQMAEGQTKTLTQPVDLLSSEEKARLHELQMRLRPKTQEEAKQAVAAKREASKVLSALEQQAQKARERQKSRRGRAHSDPLGVMLAADLADSAIIGAYHIANGAVKFAEWSKKMIEDFGDRIKPHLQALFKSAQQHHDETKRTVTEKVRTAKAPPSAAAIVQGAADAAGKIEPKTIVALARAHLLAGARDLKTLLDRVHADAVKIAPDITRREVQDALSGYGKVSEPSKKQIDVQLREMKAQARLTSAYEDATRGQPPLRTGYQRGKPSDKVRELTRAVKDAMRKMGIVTTSKEQQLASALDAVKTRLRNQIADLTKQLETGAKSPKRTGINYDAEANKLKAQRDALKKQLEDLEGPRVITEEQRIKQATAAAQRSLDEYNRRIKEHDFAPRGKRHGPDPRELNEIKRQRDEAKAHYEHLKDIANPKATPEEIALKQYKARVQAGIKNLERRAATNDFSKRTPKEIQLDEEAQRLKAKYEQAKLNERRRVKASELSQRSTARKIGDTLVKWQRGFILSGIKTLGKLTTAAFYRLALTPAEEAIGAVLSKIPGLSRVAELAPREGGLNLKAEAKSLTEGFVKGIKSFGQVLRTGKSDIDLAHGKLETFDLDRSVMDFFGHLHAAFKSPVKQAEFSRAFEKRMQNAIENGHDGTDPAVQMRVAKDAYTDAKRAIFMQDNALSNALNGFFGTLEKSKVNKGSAYFAAKIGRSLLPVVRIPTNYVAEGINYIAGVPRAGVELAWALRRGIDTLKPEEADAIMRHLKKGSLGLGLLLLGYNAPQFVGGYYTEREKRKPGDVHHGTFRMFGVEVPQWAAHAPAIEALQFGATIRRVVDGMNHAHTQATGQPGLPAASAAAALGLLSEVPALRGAETVGRLLEGSPRAWGDYGRSFLVPQGVSDIAKFSDWGNDRKQAGILDPIKASIPGLRQTLPLKATH